MQNDFELVQIAVVLSPRYAITRIAGSVTEEVSGMIALVCVGLTRHDMGESHYWSNRSNLKSGKRNCQEVCASDRFVLAQRGLAGRRQGAAQLPLPGL